MIHAVMRAPRVPAAAARFVLTAILAISVFAAVVLPGLNPNQPNQRINTPSVADVNFMPNYIIVLNFS
jgi:hypothetical protein